MTRGYWPEKKYAAKALAKFKEEYGPEKGQELFNNKFGVRRDNISLRMAIRMLRIQRDNYAQFKRLLHSCLSGIYSFDAEDMLLKCPLITLGKDPSTLRVFTNLPIDDVSDEAITNVCWVLSGVLETFESDQLKDMAGAITRRKWQNASRSWKRIKRYEEMPTATVLTRYTNLKKLKLSDTQIRDLAATIEESRKPMEIIFAEKPADFLIMYNERGLTSCMSSKHAHAKGWDSILFPKNVHPCSFYAYHPYTKGAYALHKGNIAARTILYLGEDGKWCNGRIYYANPVLGDKFRNSLVNMGIKELPGVHSNPGSDYRGGAFNRPCVFEIPAIRSSADGHYYMPIPYCDNLVPPVNVIFDKDKKVFRVSWDAADKSSDNVSLYSQQGWLREDMLTGRQCDHCRRVMGSNIRMRDTADGHAYCSADCLSSAGYVAAIRDNGSPVYVLMEGCVQDIENGTFYTNMSSALRNGALPIIYDIDCECEDELMTREGYTIYMNGGHYKLCNRELFSSYIREGKLKESTARIHGNGKVFEVVPVSNTFRLNIKTQRNVELDESEPFILDEGAVDEGAVEDQLSEAGL